MSLNYYFTNVKNAKRWGDMKEEKDCTQKELNEWAKLRYFAWLLMAVDMGEVTTKNTDEVIFRAMMFQTIIGEVFSLNGKPYVYSAKDIESYVGFSTNIATTTRTTFTKKILKMAEDKIMREVTTKMGVTG